MGVVLWPIALLFGLYALSLGRARLNQAANAAALLGLVLSAAAVLWHMAAVLLRGGISLARSMVLFPVRSNDQPQHWPAQVSSWFRQSSRAGLQPRRARGL